MRILDAVLLLSLAVSAPAAATPRSPSEAETLFGRGVEAFEAGKYEQAAALLSQAYALEPEERLAFNTALAYERAGLIREARTWYAIAAGASEPEIREAAEAALARLPAEPVVPAPLTPAAEIRREAKLLVQTSEPVAGASVRVDGGHPLELPATVVVTPGLHLLSAAAPAYHPQEATVAAEAGMELPVVLRLVPVEADRGVPVWWMTGGVSTAALLSGAGFYLAAASDFDEAARLGKEGTDRVGFDRAQADGRRAATLSNASYGVAVLAGAVTGLLWWWDRKDDADSELTLIPTAGPGEAGVAATWRP